MKKLVLFAVMFSSALAFADTFICNKSEGRIHMLMVNDIDKTSTTGLLIHISNSPAVQENLATIYFEASDSMSSNNGKTYAFENSSRNKGDIITNVNLAQDYKSAAETRDQSEKPSYSLIAYIQKGDDFVEERFSSEQCNGHLEELFKQAEESR